MNPCVEIYFVFKSLFSGNFLKSHGTMKATQESLLTVKLLRDLMVARGLGGKSTTIRHLKNKLVLYLQPISPADLQHVSMCQKACSNPA